MKKQLLFIGLFIAAFTTAIQAQTLTYESLPETGIAGESSEFTLSYTSTVESKLEASLYIFDVDGEGTLTQDWGTWQAGIIQGNLPATATASEQTLILDIPSSVAPSSELPAGKTYVWALSLKDMSDGWITGEQVATTIIASGGVANSINFSGTSPATVSAGQSVEINYNYTLENEGKVKVALSLYNGDNWANDAANFIIDPAAAASTPVEGVATIGIPTDITPSDELEAGQSYKWEIAVYDPNWTYFTGAKSDVTVTATAGIDNNSFTTVAVYPNPVSNILSIKTALPIDTVSVYDITGKALIQLQSANTVDVSSLAAGMYFIKINNSKAVKFIKR